MRKTNRSPRTTTNKFVILSILGLFLLNGCGLANTTTIPSTIPITIKANRQVVRDKIVNFEYIPIPAANNIVANFAMGATDTYSINLPLESMTKELVMAKFGQSFPDETVADKITVELLELKTNTDNIMHSIEMSMKVTVTNNGEEKTKLIAYSTTLEADAVPGYYTVKYKLPKVELRDFLVTFALEMDMFLDTIF